MFDPIFFSISPQDASLMDPNQRIFLETAWNSIDNAGYSSSIKGTNTGVFVGYSSDFGADYSELVELYSPELRNRALAGNIN